LGKCSQIKRFIIIAIIFFFPAPLFLASFYYRLPTHTYIPLYQNTLSIPTYSYHPYVVFVRGSRLLYFRFRGGVLVIWSHYTRILLNTFQTAKAPSLSGVLTRWLLYLNTYELYSVYIVLNNIYKSRLPRLHVAG